MKVAVLGAEGFLGKNLMEEFKKEHIAAKGFGKKTCDITNQKQVLNALKGYTYVVHLAALTSVKNSFQNESLYHAVNIHGTLNVLLASKKLGIKKVIFASTSYVYGNSKTFPQKETDPLNPLSPYAISKLVGEFYCRVYSEKYGLETIPLRFYNLYGPKQDPSFGVISSFVDAAKHNKPARIFGNGKQQRDFLYVDDACLAIVKALKTSKKANGLPINIGSGKAVSILNVLKIIQKELKTKIKVKKVAFNDPVQKTQADTTRAKKMLNWIPKVTLRKGISSYFNEN